MGKSQIRHNRLSEIFKIQWLQILDDNIFLTLEWQFHSISISDSICGFNPLKTKISIGKKCSNNLDNSEMLFHVAISNLFIALQQWN